MIIYANNLHSLFDMYNICECMCTPCIPDLHFVCSTCKNKKMQSPVLSFLVKSHVRKVFLLCKLVIYTMPDYNSIFKASHPQKRIRANNTLSHNAAYNTH